MQDTFSEKPDEKTEVLGMSYHPVQYCVPLEAESLFEIH